MEGIAIHSYTCRERECLNRAGWFAGSGATGLIPVEEGKGLGVQTGVAGETSAADAQQGEEDTVSKMQLQQSLKLILSGKQSLDPVSEPDSPVMTSEEASAKARSGDMALEEALQEGVFNELMQDQLLNKGQRINIGSPDTYFRPVYATAAGVKSAPEAAPMVQGRLQVISTSVLNDPEHMEQMNRQFHNEPRPYDEETAAAVAAAEVLAAAAAAGKAGRPPIPAARSASSPADTAAAPSSAAAEESSADNPMIAIPSDPDMKGLNPFQGLADATSSRKLLPTAAETERPAGMFASAPLQKGPGASAGKTEGEPICLLRLGRVFSCCQLVKLAIC